MSENENKNLGKSLTFDDILFVPRYSEVLPKDADLSTNLTPDIKLNIPLMSAAMDTVSESNMAIAMARNGGIGIIHKNMTIEEQVQQIRKVKRSETWIISDPITVDITFTVAQIRDKFQEHNITGVPVVDENNIPVGIVTGRDLRFLTEKDNNVPAKDIMTKKLITVSVDTPMDECKELLHIHKIEKLLVTDSEGKLAGMITFRDISVKGENPNACMDSKGGLLVGAAVGASGDALDRIDALVAAGTDVIIIDTAHGHSKNVITTVATASDKYPDVPFIAGNIATGEAALELIKAGAKAVKVGIGPGSICTTRVVAGIGVPQITAIENVYAVTKEYNIPLIADGGIRYSGDIVKALAVGADVVMLGNLLAGTDESPGETIIYEGRTFKTYRGMGSLGAMNEGSSDRYFQSKQSDTSKYIPEGIEGIIPHRGKVKDTLFQMTGGIRSGMGYLGCKTLQELKTNASFYEITSSGYKESHPHDLKITKESPNYHIE